MTSRLLRVLLTLWVLGLAGVPTLAQSERTIEISVIDEQDQPLTDAKVIVRPTVAPAPVDEFTLPEKVEPAAYALAMTDANGKAVVAVTKPGGDEIDATWQVMAWKPGYGMHSATVHKTATLRCLPLGRRTVQIVDALGKPMQGLRVEHVQNSITLRDDPNLRWWPQEVTQTDELGLATLATLPNGQLSLVIHESNGTIHRCAVNDVGRQIGRSVDLRSVSVVRLTPYGHIEGKLAPEFSRDYVLRVFRDFANFSSQSSGNWTMLNSMSPAERITADKDGNFRIDAVAEGSTWLVAYRLRPVDPAKDAAPTKAPAAIHRVDVVQGKVARVDIESVPVARVSGRVVLADPASDLAGVQVSIGMSAQDSERGSSPQFPVGVARCAADGSYVCWLGVGSYRLMPSHKAHWKIESPVTVAVGAGAATIVANDIHITPLIERKVRWKRDARVANSLVGNSDNRLIFRSGDRQIGDCYPSADGYGKVYLPPNEVVTNISKDATYTSTQVSGAFVDRDPSENFDLELIQTAQGMATNVGMRGRVVDAEGKGVSRVPVSISLNVESSASNGTRISMRSGSQLLDIVMSDATGNFVVPPRQLFSRITIPGGTGLDETHFIFTVSTPANPSSIEAQKLYTLKPDSWSILEIDFPDLVVDRPLGGGRLSGKVLNAEGQPSTGEWIRLSDKRGLVRTLSDREGRFSINDLAGPTWLLRESDWSIRQINDYSHPMTFGFDEESLADASGNSWQRMDRNQRLQLAKTLLNAVPVPQIGPLQGRIHQVSDEFFLEPNKEFEQLLLLNGANADQQRLQFVNFWSDLSDEKLEQFALAMNGIENRVHLLRLLADRHPSVAAYEKVMHAIEYPRGTNGRSPAVDPMLQQLVAVGTKLHNYRALAPHRVKIRQFIDLYMSEADAAPANPLGNGVAPPAARTRTSVERPVLDFCRALVDAEVFALRVLDELNESAEETSPENRSLQMRDTSVLLQLFPATFLTLPANRGSLSNAMFVNWGEQSPLEALEAVKQGKLTPDVLRVVTTAALASHHADAEQVFWESVRLLLRADSSRDRISSSMLGMLSPFELPSSSNRPVELVWYGAAQQSSPKMGRVAAWMLAHDCLSGKYEENNTSILPQRERMSPALLVAAYCLATDFPDLTTHIKERALPRALQSIDRDFGQTYRNTDVSLAAWLDPQATTDFVIKLQKRLDEEQKNQPAGQRDPRFSVKQAELMSLRSTCLRGLLVDRL